MANEFITATQVVERMIADAEKSIADMPIDSLRKLAIGNLCGFGIRGALGASLILAAKNRIAALDGS